jgi:hypothetical protein
MRKIGFFGSLLAIALLSACTLPMRFTEVKGSGDIVTESRRLVSFDTVEFNSIGTLIIEQGDTDSLDITTDKNIMKYIRSDVREGKLILSTSDYVSLQPSKDDITYHLTVKDLSTIKASGLGNIEVKALKTGNLRVEINGTGILLIDDLQANTLDLEISGEAKAEIIGSVENQTVDISGTGTYHAGDLFSHSAEIKISGSGSVEVWAVDELNLNVSGIGELSYYGDPILNTDISGTGTMKSLGTK